MPNGIIGAPWTTRYWHYSGRYRLGGSTFGGRPLPMRPLGRTPSPIHNLRQTKLLPAPGDGGGHEQIVRIYMNLHVDIDRHDPLNVISGIQGKYL